MILALGTAAVVAQRLRLLNLQLRRRDRARSEQFHVALSNMSQGLAMYDRHNRLTVSNRRYCELTGVPPLIMRPGRSFREVLEAHKAVGNFPGRDVEDILQEREQLLERGEAATLTARMANGRTVSVHFRPLPSGGWIGTYSDITEQKRAEEHIRYLAHHDPLTNLPNRTKLLQVLDQALAEPEDGLAVLFLDLDGFKVINDTWGRQGGRGAFGGIQHRGRAREGAYEHRDRSRPAGWTDLRAAAPARGHRALRREGGWRRLLPLLRGADGKRRLASRPGSFGRRLLSGTGARSAGGASEEVRPQRSSIRISRLPTALAGLTTPWLSICSTSRAALL